MANLPADEKVTKAKHLRLTTFAFACVLSIYLASIFVLMPGFTPAKGLCLIVILILFGCAGIIRDHRFYNVGAVTLVTVTIVAGVGASLTNGGADGYVAPVLILAPIAAGYFLTVRATIIATIAVVASLILLCALDTSGFIPEPAYSARQIELASLILLSMVAVMCGLAAVVYSRTSQAALKQFVELNDELEMIFDHVPVRIWMKDAHNKILRLNQHAADSMGLTIEEAEGASTYELFPEMAAKYHEDDLSVLKSKQPKLGIIESYAPKDKKAGWVRTDKVPYTDSDGNDFIFVAAIDITDQINDRNKLKESEERYQLAIAGASDGVWDWDINSDKVHYSPRNFQMLGDVVRDTADSYQWCIDRLHPDDIPAINAALVEHLKNDTEYDVKYRIMHNDGSWRWWRSRGKAVRDSDGRATRMIGINSDVTELVKAQIRAENANEAKSRFLANVSHEIRTPLNGVLGMAQALKRTKLDNDQLHQINTVVQSGETLSSVLNDILDISKIEASELRLEARDIDLRALIQSVLSLFKSTADQKGIRLIWRDELCTPLFVKADGVRLRQVLSNLVSNAIKFTNTGQVEFALNFDRTTKACPTVFEFSVTDTGIGISKSASAVIFEPFHQESSITTREFGGTGLGLTIAKSLTELMNGEIAVDSKEGEGTTFRLTIPLEISHDRQLDTVAMDADSEDATADKTLKVLLAEDNEINQLVVKQLLTSINVELTVVQNGREALRLTSEEQFDLILMDVQMPTMDGLEATQRIRDRERVMEQEATPLVMLTANVMEHQLSKYKAVGADGVIAKPINEQELFDSVRRFAAA